jgi:uncharacterized protein
MALEEPVQMTTATPTTAPVNSNQPVVFTQLTDEERQWGQYCHFAGVLGILGTLICWLMKKDTSKYLDMQGKTAVNFHITNVIIAAVCAITIIGIPIAMAVNVYSLIFSILGGMKAKDGQIHQYPFSFNLIK